MAELAHDRRDWVLTNAVLADVDRHGRLRVEDGWLHVRGDHIVARGTGRTPSRPQRVDARGALVTPALVECHSHLLFAGNRVGDWMRRVGLEPADPRLGTGGITATAQATRALGDAELVTTTLARLASLARTGVGTLELKTGYGLDAPAELRLARLALDVAERARREFGLEVLVTFLGLHAVPTEPTARRDVIDEMTQTLDALPRGVRFADAFVDPVGVSAEEARPFLQAARARSLGLRLHVDQFGDAGGAGLAASLGALSADHLDASSAAAIAALAAAGTVGVLTPIATVLTGAGVRPPVAALRDAGVRLAVSADANPGTSPSADLRLATLLAVNELGLRPDEAFAGVTTHAARALGLVDRGTLDVDARADVVAWPASHPFEIVLSHLPLEPWRPLPASPAPSS